MTNQRAWIPIEERLPMADVEPGIIGEYLTVVELKNPDPNDEPEIMILWFDTGIQQFTLEPGGRPYSDEHEWHVTHWMELPELPYRFSLGKTNN